MNPILAEARHRLRILVCFDSPVLQAGMMATLSRHADLDCRDDGASIHREGFMPEVIVADHARAIAWARTVASMASGTRPRILIVTDSEREIDIRAALSGGAHGYLMVNDPPDHLVRAIRSVQSGKRTLSPQVASRLAVNMAQEPLTQREQAVLGLVVDGLCNKSIARCLNITAGTVKSHLRSTFSKLGVSSRTQAIAMAHRRGLLHAAPSGHADSAAHAVPQSLRARPPVHAHPALAVVGN